MFPNLRLMLSASLAIIVLVAIVGSSLVLFRPPPARMADMPDIVRPVMAIADDGRPPLRVDASARRSSELQRLLTLPSGPSRAYAAEPPAAFPYEVTVVAAPAAPPSSPAQPASVEPQAPPATIVAALPEEPIREPEPMAAAEPPATVPDEVTTAATPEPVTVLSPPAEPETVAPQAMAPEPPPATVVAALPEPPRQPEPMAAAESAGAPATGSHVPDPPVDTAAPVAGIETVPVSSIPAVDDAPIPRPKPQLALADPNSATGKPDDQRPKASPPQRVKAKAKPRRRATLSRRLKRPLPPSTPLESQQNQFPFFDNGVIGDAGGRSSSPADQASAGRPQRAGYAIRPPTGPAR